jgi:hypothetical protein
MKSKRHTFGSYVLGFLAAWAMLALAAPAQAQDPRFIVDSVQYNGSGCPARSAEVTVEGNTLVVAFSEMMAPSPFLNNAPAVSCSITARVRFAGGIRVNLAQINYAGIAVAERRDTVMLSRRAFFAGTRGSSARSRITRTGDFLFSDVEIFPTIESCGRNGGTDLVGTTVQLLATGPTAFVNLATVDAEIRLLFNIRPC